MVRVTRAAKEEKWEKTQDKKAVQMEVVEARGGNARETPDQTTPKTQTVHVPALSRGEKNEWQWEIKGYWYAISRVAREWNQKMINRSAKQYRQKADVSTGMKESSCKQKRV